MFDAELFGLTPGNFLATAQVLLIPTLGFLFLYLLALPLKKLPVVDVPNYQPPAWVLPIFALGSLFLVIFCLTVALILSKHQVDPSAEKFEKAFHIVRRLVPPPGVLASASIAIKSYDGASNFRIFVNGYRLFGSSSNCVMNYQCKQVGDTRAEQSFREIQKSFREVEAAKSIGLSIYHIHRLYSLPHVEDISGYLVPGRNFIDVHSENSGLGDCRMQVALEVSVVGSPKNTYTLDISPDAGTTASADQPLAAQEMFYSGGLPASDVNPDPDEEIPVYGTNRSDGSYRLCQRIRIEFHLSDAELRQLDPQWDRWARARRHELVCEIFDDSRKGCGN